MIDAGGEIHVGPTSGRGASPASAPPGELGQPVGVDELRRAIHRHELVLHHQPKVELVSGRVTGVEALVRWQHPIRGLVGPAQFITVAEQAGLIGQLGTWVLREACRDAARWQIGRRAPTSFRVSVNVSAMQFNPSLPPLVQHILEENCLDGNVLCIELTESVVMNDVANATATISALKRLGVTVSVDDFGTGYSSLAYLKRFDLDELKIDRSFVYGLAHSAEDRAIAAAIVAMAHALHLDIVAEGVEDELQLAELRILGCSHGQGFLFSRAVPAPELDRQVLDGVRFDIPGTSSRRQTDLVLVVDDAPFLRQIASVSLTAHGFEVVEAEDGPSALAVAAARRPACILLDVDMPGLDGIEVCKALRELPSTSDTVIVMVTAAAERTDKVAAFSAGADDYIVKPFAPRDLATRVREAMNRRGATIRLP